MSGSNEVTYQIEIHQEDGSYWATVQELPGVFASGETLQELNEALAEAIGLYLSTPGSTVTVTNLERAGEPKIVGQRFLVDA